MVAPLARNPAYHSHQILHPDRRSRQHQRCPEAWKPRDCRGYRYSEPDRRRRPAREWVEYLPESPSLRRRRLRHPRPRRVRPLRHYPQCRDCRRSPNFPGCLQRLRCLQRHYSPGYLHRPHCPHYRRHRPYPQLPDCLGCHRRRDYRGCPGRRCRRIRSHEY